MPARADRPVRSAHVARAEVRADRLVPALITIATRLDGEHLARRSDARLGEPQQLPQADAAVPAVPARVSAGAVADHAHDAHATASRCSPSSTARPTPGSRPAASAARSSCRTTTPSRAATSRRRSGITTTSFGVTRLDVGFGLSGFSILRDPARSSRSTRGGNSRHPRHRGSERVDVDDRPRSSRVSARNHTQGTALGVAGGAGLRRARRPAFQLTAALPTTITLDFFLPTQQPNPFWFGAVQMYVDCPSKGVNNAFRRAGRADRQADRTVQHADVPGAGRDPQPRSAARARTSTCASRSTCRPTRPGTYLLDNIRGVADRADHGAARAASSRCRSSSRIARSAPTAACSTRRRRSPPGTLGAQPRRQPVLDADRRRQTNLVNGKVWPNMNVKRHAYRFRILELGEPALLPVPAVERHAGHDHRQRRRLHEHASRRSPRSRSGVTERVDIIIDFSNIPVGHEDRPAEHRAAASRRSAVRRIPTRTARSCSSPSSAARRFRRSRCPTKLGHQSRR